MSSAKPKVSIVVPVYNPGSYFPPCLESLAEQTIFSDIEVVLVDDGSTDGSEALCDEFAARHPGQVQVIHQSNHGLGYTRNAGIESATGEWILFVDSDDAITPDACERLLAAGESSGADMVWGEYTHSSSFIGGVAELAAQGPVEYRRLLRIALHEGTYIITPCHYLYRAGFLQEHCIRFAQGGAWEEQQWLMRLILANPRVMRIDCHYYIYNVGDHPSLSTKLTAKHLMDAIDVVYAEIDELEAANPPAEVREVAEMFIANSIAKNALTYFSRASVQVQALARLRLNEKYAHYASRTGQLPLPLRRIGLAFVRSPELYEEELAHIREARRKAREAEERPEAVKVQAEGDNGTPDA